MKPTLTIKIIMMINNNYYLKFFKILKYIGLLTVIIYSVLVFTANIFYYKLSRPEYPFLPKINFGIDIVGGNQLTVAIDVSQIISEVTNNNEDFLKNYCNNNKIDCDIKNINDKNINEKGISDNKFKILINKHSKKDNSTVITKKELKTIMNNLRSSLDIYDLNVEENNASNVVITATVAQKKIEKIISDTTDKAIAILKSRIDSVGVKEIVIQRYGHDKIVILVPHSVNIERIKHIISTTAKLNFHLMDKTHIFKQKPEQIMPKHILLPSYKTFENEKNIFYMVEEKPALNGNCMLNVQPNIDGISNSIVFRMNSTGAKKFAEITKNNIGRLLAIVIDDQVLMSPIINIPINGGNGTITGHFSVQEVQDLSTLLRSGSLPAKISIISERSLSSIFNKNILSKASKATAICFFLFSIIITFTYRKLGIVSIVALLLNFLFTLMIIAVFGFTLTLPGIAGFIIMLGMAIDANILIFEKMKELKRQNVKDPKTIIQNSFSGAFSTILDSNITTIIAGIALFNFGGSFIKGFSITMIFGILCSMFTAVNITRMIINKIFLKVVN